MILFACECECTKHSFVDDTHLNTTKHTHLHLNTHLNTHTHTSKHTYTSTRPLGTRSTTKIITTQGCCEIQMLCFVIFFGCVFGFFGFHDTHSFFFHHTKRKKNTCIQSETHFFSHHTKRKKNTCIQSETDREADMKRHILFSFISII